MKKLLGVLALLFFSSTALAYEVQQTEVSRPYEVVQLFGAPSEPQAYLGTLEDFPVMYEVTSGESFTLELGLRQLARGEEPIPFGIIVVKQNAANGGVTEIARLRPESDEWQRAKDKKFGITFWDMPLISEEVGPGTYRIEVSTPENVGRYLLTYGSVEDTGYFEQLGNTRAVQQYFGFSIFRMLTSSCVYYALGLFLLLYIGYRVMKYRKSIAHAD